MIQPLAQSMCFELKSYDISDDRKNEELEDLTEEQLDPQEKQDREIQRGQLGINDPQRLRDEKCQQWQDDEEAQ